MRYPQNTLDQAKAMYMQYKNATEISNTTGMTVRNVHYYMQNHWNKEREAAKQEFFEYVAGNKKSILLDITDRALNIISHALKDIQDKKVSLNLNEIKAISEVLERIDKIVKLDDGKPSEISMSIPPATIVELKQRLKADPFLTIEDAHVEEVTPTINSDLNEPNGENH